MYELVAEAHVIHVTHSLDTTLMLNALSAGHHSHAAA